MWLRLSEFFQKLAEAMAMIGLYFIPTFLFVAAFVFIADGNVPGVFLWLGISEIISWMLFGLCVLLEKHFEKKFQEFAADV